MQRIVVYYFISYPEEKKHIWFQILCDCVSNLILAYGTLLKWINLYQLLFLSCAVVDLVELFIIIDALTWWLNNQRYRDAKVSVLYFLPEFFMPSIDQVRKLNFTPVRSKDFCECC